MMKIILSHLIVISLVLSCTNSCDDHLYDIDVFTSNIREARDLMEANFRAQYNTLHGERIKAVGAQLGFLKRILLDFSDVCKYKMIDLGLERLYSIFDLIGTVRKNVFHAVRARFNELRAEHTVLIFTFMSQLEQFISEIEDPIRSYFPDGKKCVFELEPNIRQFFEGSSAKYIQCIKNSSLTNPIQHPKFKASIDDMTKMIKEYNAKMMLSFQRPVFITSYSTYQQNLTAANNFNEAVVALFPAALDIIKNVAQAGQTLLSNIEAHSKAGKICVSFVNVTNIVPKIEEFTGTVLRYCGSL